jgi:hypothetical protein
MLQAGVLTLLFEQTVLRVVGSLRDTVPEEPLCEGLSSAGFDLSRVDRPVGSDVM